MNERVSELISLNSFSWLAVP